MFHNIENKRVDCVLKIIIFTFPDIKQNIKNKNMLCVTIGFKKIICTNPDINQNIENKYVMCYNRILKNNDY